MNDDDLPALMVMLKAEHRLLDEEIERMRTSGNCDQLDLVAQIADRITPDILA